MDTILKGIARYTLSQPPKLNRNKCRVKTN